MEITKGMEFAIQAAMRICGVDRNKILEAFAVVETIGTAAKELSDTMRRIEENQKRIMMALGVDDNGETRRNEHGTANGIGTGKC